MKDVVLRTEGLAKDFTLHLQGGVRIPVLAGIDLAVPAGCCGTARRHPARRLRVRRLVLPVFG